ncbi:response regulator transcription factor [Pseudoalteromonas denitrificans]|uniref:Phosphate regulon transcriptional regulatory protein PhoB n=1 Tax=Pseudoalteromonas denitrificans DSM 6059 TaxID=1123010 RepID=A0A1I1MLE9_9GAMM|nr:response regulator transcription factor [Pseudoalteromonas denitrificans]SFC82370.1 DNA-binding response regulator, OmpR family, contains REC and winged-helix (wHTH) domain [Pseudoalteromonas denitrificans DSM 6059]
MQDKILVVEDDHDIAGILQVHLAELSLKVDHVTSAELALKAIQQHTYSVLLLDIMLPGMDGLTLCRKIKDKSPEQSILMLTARSAEMDRILGLEMGADDYITKPFSTRELQARVKAQLRHVHLLRDKHNPKTDIKSVYLGKLLINLQSHEVYFDNETISLTSTEFDLLHFFAKHPNQVFSRTQLLDSVWGYQHSGYEHTVNSHINRLRSKLEQTCNTHIIETVWGVGYKLNSNSLIHH